MRLLRHPVVGFLLVSGALLVVIAVVAGRLADRAAEEGALAERRATNRLVTAALVEPYLKERLFPGSSKSLPGTLDRFDREMRQLVTNSPARIEALTVRAADGTVVYAPDLSLIGQVYPLTAAEEAALLDGGTGSAPAGDRAPLVPAGPDGSPEDLVQVFTGSQTPQGRQVLVEAFYDVQDIEARRAEIYNAYRWITVGPFLLLVVIVTCLLTLLTRQLRTASRDRERLLRSAISASDAERRRIARDLHDGVVQDLAGTAFSLSALSRDPATPTRARDLLEDTGVALRDSLKALRSLLAEIHPPDLHARGLAAALSDLVAPAEAAGIEATVAVHDDVAHAPDAEVALVWRVAQEAVRNAIRHSAAGRLSVEVGAAPSGLVLEVADDGVGFDPEAVRDRSSYGLRGLQSLVEDTGGSLVVDSAPGEGTRVLLRVER